MKFRFKIALFAVNVIMCVLIILSTVFFMNGWSVPVKIICYSIAGVGLIFGTVTFALKKDALFKSGFVLVCCAFAVTASIALVSRFANLNDYKTDEEKIQKLAELIKNTGGWGMVMYVIFQILQVVILPVPAAVCYIPGSLIWGPLTATFLASLGVIMGSVTAYAIGRFFGKRVVVWIAGEKSVEKYSKVIGKKGKVIFLLMQILPFFPDDILCMIGYSGVLLSRKRNCNSFQRLGNSGMDSDFCRVCCSCAIIVKISGQIRKLACIEIPKK